MLSHNEEPTARSRSRDCHVCLRLWIHGFPFFSNGFAKMGVPHRRAHPPAVPEPMILSTFRAAHPSPLTVGSLRTSPENPVPRGSHPGSPSLSPSPGNGGSAVSTGFGCSLHINGAIRCVTLCGWLLSCSITFSRSVQAAAWVRALLISRPNECPVYGHTVSLHVCG